MVAGEPVRVTVGCIAGVWLVFGSGAHGLVVERVLVCAELAPRGAAWGLVEELPRHYLN